MYPGAPGYNGNAPAPISGYGASPASTYTPTPSAPSLTPSYGEMSSVYGGNTAAPAASTGPPSIPGFGPPPTHAAAASAPAPPPAYAPPAPAPPPAYAPPAPTPPPAYAPPAPAPYAPAGPPVWGAPPPQPAPYTPPPPPAPAPPPQMTKKRALLIGCSYPGTPSQLSGCINDVQCMDYGLKKHYGLTDSEILILRDDGYARSPDFVSTRANILRAIQWLTSDLSPGTHLFFHFSGHGGQQRSTRGDEADGMDETIMPTDYARAGPIIDNDLNALLVQVLPPGVILHAVVDACHSGTAFDLPFTSSYDYYRQQYVWGQEVGGYTRGGLALQIGACLDKQTAQDTNRNTGGAVFTGAATFAFLQAIETNGPRCAYGALLSAMANQLVTKSAGQFPVLSCSQALDLSTPLLI